MTQPEQAAILFEQVFTRIQHEQMAGIPILNNSIKVQTLGFQIYQGRCIGVLITPWLMSLVMLPEDEDWSDLKLGSKQEHWFPANSFRFIVNQVDGIGFYQSHSLYSPMHKFSSQEHAVAAAESFLQTLMVAVERPDQDPHDEELLGRILRGEEEVDLSEFDTIEPILAESQNGTLVDTMVKADNHISRRDLLRGSFLKSDRGS
jgi:[NiFe] hydrogenase assembly HybE family chaperone